MRKIYLSIAMVFGVMFFIGSDCLFSKVINVDSKKSNWQNSGISVKKGDIVKIKSSGEVRVWMGKGKYGNESYSDPNGWHVDCDNGSIVRTLAQLPDPYNIAPGCGYIFGLVAKIGEKGTPFFVGSEYTATVFDEGNLFFGISETNFAGGCADNQGSWKVDVNVKSGEKKISGAGLVSTGLQNYEGIDQSYPDNPVGFTAEVVDIEDLGQEYQFKIKWSVYDCYGGAIVCGAFGIDGNKISNFYNGNPSTKPGENGTSKVKIKKSDLSTGKKIFIFFDWWKNTDNYSNYYKQGAPKNRMLPIAEMK